MITFIFCTGMRRSASTLQYNIVKRILELSDKGKALGYAEYPDIIALINENIESDGYYVIKVHDYFPLAQELNKQGKAKIIFSYRDIRDIIVSSMFKWNGGSFKKAYTKKYIGILKKSYKEWKSLKGIYSSSYEDIMNSLEIEVINICQFLNIDLSSEEIERISNELSFENLKKEISHKTDFDKTIHGEMEKETLLHKNHLRSGKKEQWRTELKNYEIAIIQKDWRDWLVENKYPVFNTLYNCNLILNLKLKSLSILKTSRKTFYPIFKNTIIHKYYRNFKNRTI